MDGFFAAREREDIGRLFYIRPVGSGVWELFLAADCAGVEDGGYLWMQRNDILIEVDYRTAQRWGTVGRLIEIEMKRVPDVNRSPVPD